MAKLLNKDPFTYNKERDGFLKELQRFHANRGSPFARLPYIGGKQVDVYLLYVKVTGLGGWEKVTNESRWEDIQEHFHIPRACTNAAQALKNIYMRYLGIYEKINHFGEDPNQRGDDDLDQGQHSARKKSAALVYAVPLTYNVQQHSLPDYSIRMLGLPTPIGNRAEFKKVEAALECGLPNEVDFAFNVCTLLSNEGKHIIKVCRCPRVLTLLLAHVGIFEAGPGSLKELHTDGWSNYAKRNYLRFWYESVEDSKTRALILPEGLMKDQKARETSDILKLAPEENESHNSEFLHLGRDIGTKEVEGLRIAQLASILRNLSFEDENMTELARNPLVFRFLMLCIHSKYSNLKQLGLDTLGNIALKMVLGPVEFGTTQYVLRTLTATISSQDKFKVVSGMDMLARLCQVDENDEVLSDNLDPKVYEHIVALLTVHDIQLIVHTLEALYQLSELGTIPCTRISESDASIDTLVSLVTVEAQSYGPGSLIGIKVVEQVPAGVVQQQMQQHPMPQGNQTPQQAGRGVAPPTPQPGTPLRQSMPPPAAHGTPTHAQNPAQHHVVGTPPAPQRAPVSVTSATHAASPRPPCPQAFDSNPDAMACNWVQSHYEWASDCLITRMELYGHYVATCAKFGTKNIAVANSFANCVRVVFPQVEHLRMVKPDGSVDIQYKGLRKRNVPLPFPPPAASGDAHMHAAQPRMQTSNSAPTIPPAQGSPLQNGPASHRPPGPPQSIPRGVLHSALQQRLASPPMSPQIRTQERPTGPISPTSYPTIQQALLNQPVSAMGSSQVTTSQPGSPLPSSPTSITKPTDSNLIKSLLANKVTQNMQRLQQQHQHPQAAQGHPGQIHPGLIQAHTAGAHPPEPKSGSRAKKRKASSSPTPIEPKIPAIVATPDQPKPDLPLVIPTSSPNTGSQVPLLPPVTGAATTVPVPKEEPMEVEPERGDAIKTEAHAPSAVGQSGNVACGQTKSVNTPQFPGVNSQSGSLANCTSNVLVSEGNGGEVNGHKTGEATSHSATGSVCVNGGKGGGKAQEPLVNGLCSPAPSETDSDTPNKDSIKMDISQMKNSLALVEQINDKKEQISAILNENSKQQLFGLNGVVNHMGNGDCRMALHMDLPMEKKSEAEEKTSAPVENGYLSPSESTSHQPNGEDNQDKNGTKQKIPHETSTNENFVQSIENTHQTGPTPTSDAQLSVSGSVQSAGGTAAHTASRDLSQAAVLPAPPAVHTTTAMALPAASSLPSRTAPHAEGAQPNASQNQRAQSSASASSKETSYDSNSGARSDTVTQPVAIAPKIPSNLLPTPNPPLHNIPTVVHQNSAGPLPSGSTYTTDQTRGISMQPGVPEPGKQMPPHTSVLVSQLQAQTISTTTMMAQGQQVVSGQVVLVQQNGQQVPMVLQQQGVQPQVAQAGVPGAAVSNVIHPAQFVQQGQVMQAQRQAAPPGQILANGQVVQGHVIQGQAQVVQGQILQGQIPGQVISQAQAGQQGNSSTAQSATARVTQQVAQQPPIFQQGQVLQGQVQLVQAGQPVSQGQLPSQAVMAPHQMQVTQQNQAPAQPVPVTQSHIVASLQQPVQILPAVTGQAIVPTTGSQGAMQGVVVMSGAQGQPGWTSVSLNPQTLTQQMVAAQKLITPGQRPVQPGPPPIAPRHQMVVVSETQTGGPNPILQQQLQMPPRATTPTVVQAAQVNIPSIQPATTPIAGQSTPTSKSAKKKKPPPKKIAKKEGGDSRPPSASPPPPAPLPPAQPAQPIRFTCDWRGCNAVFDTWQLVGPHVMKNHFSRSIPRVQCMWEGCDNLQRAKWSFHTHLHDRHLTESALKAAAVKRQQAGHQPPPPPPPPPGAPPVYPNDAAYQAIRRFTMRPPFPEFAEVKEGPVTKHIRLTSALILRNLARYSANGRSVIKRYEEHLSYVALSNVESSNALANCLWELQHHH